MAAKLLEYSHIIVLGMSAVVVLLLVFRLNRAEDTTEKLVRLINQTIRDSPDAAARRQQDDPPPPEKVPGKYAAAAYKKDPCRGRYIYVHDVPRRFNDGMFDGCGEPDANYELCRYGINEGFREPLTNEDDLYLNSGWYATEPYSLEVIFFHRMMRYECLTNDSSAAAAFYVPFYGGIDSEKNYFNNISGRDALLVDLADWLVRRPEWNAVGGKDHFTSVGVVTWSVRRYSDEGWGSALETHPVLKNMVFLIVEALSWVQDNDYAIPWPSYFHPKTDGEVTRWQEKMRSASRPWLFTFVGAFRNDSVRGPIIEQCKASTRCKLMQCDKFGTQCHVVSNVMAAFESADFCLQPPGDTPTRRSIFDALLAGCVPVFFNADSAYKQYRWHFPSNASSYSVFIPEEDVRFKNASIEAALRAIPRRRVKEMREVVIGLMPRLLYAHHDAELTTPDAFDVAIDAAIRTIAAIRLESSSSRGNGGPIN